MGELIRELDGDRYHNLRRSMCPGRGLPASRSGLKAATTQAQARLQVEAVLAYRNIGERRGR